MKVVILGAGFGGLELATSLSEALGNEAEIILIDKNDSFVFGYSKLNVMFGRESADEVRFPYHQLTKPGVKFQQEMIINIDPMTKRVTTDKDVYDADILVIALGADYDVAATHGLADGAVEFYSYEGALNAKQAIADFKGGDVVIAVATPNFKCPPAPNEAALMLDEHLRQRGIREKSTIRIVSPLPIPIPVSPGTSQSILNALSSKGIPFQAGARITQFDPNEGLIHLAGGEPVHYDLALAVPVHRPPDVIRTSGIGKADGWMKVDPATLQTEYPDVYALGDVASVGVPKAGVFSEGQAKAVAKQIIGRARGERSDDRYDGTGVCYLEMGGKDVGRVDVNFLGGPHPTATFTDPTPETYQEKQQFGAVRAARWFGN